MHSDARTDVSIDDVALQNADSAYVSATFEARGIPSENAAVFTSATGHQWEVLKNIIQMKLISTGLTSTVTDFNRKYSSIITYSCCYHNDSR